MFNVGFAPARQSIRKNPAFTVRPNQIELYAEMFDQVPWDADRWRRSGCGSAMGGNSPMSRRGAERLRLWQSGAMCFVIASFRRPY
jgi:hypothetical protein